MQVIPRLRLCRRCLFALCSGLAALLMASPASALYKCVIDKKTTFQEQPCPTGSSQTVIRSQFDAPEQTFTPMLVPLNPPGGAAGQAAAAPGGNTPGGNTPGGNAPGGTTPAAPNAGPTDQEKLDTMESERLKREAAYALRDKVAALANQQAACERNFGVVFSRGGPNGSISGAVYQQQVMGETNAAAQRCIARTNELQQEVGAARFQCASRSCDKP